LISWLLSCCTRGASEKQTDAELVFFIFISPEYQQTQIFKAEN